MPNATYHFPPGFRWGVATASHQNEGGNTNNQWWAWEHQPGRIAEGHTSGVACNWWDSAEEDFDRAADMGLNALRLSVEWSRVEIAPGRIDTAALDRYRELLQGLTDRGMQPMVTLHHFTDPQWLTEKGGWLNPDAIQYFTRYVEQVVRALGDSARIWCTINEPNVYAALGYILGDFPPGETSLRPATVVLRHMIRAHAAAYRTIHRLQEDAEVGLAHNVRCFAPSRPKRFRDRLAATARDYYFNQLTVAAAWNGWWLPPLGLGPALAARRSLDWLGINYYSRERVAYSGRDADVGLGEVVKAEGVEYLDGDFGEFYPEGLYRAVKRYARLGLPIYITEHGLPDDDDDQRPRAILHHLHHLWRAIQENIPVAGYYHWTLVDNFEWAEGWTMPFGLIELDPDTQKRTPRPSRDLYAGIARGNAITPELIDAYAPELRPVLLPG
jgi:beta-glucosidase